MIQVLLMSGLSRSALEDLVSESDDRLVHICNILRFCMLRKDRALSAIGGPWDTVDGGDPSTDDTSLVQTALRHTKDITNLDLHNCRHWNRFLEIHYDRIGKDGLFSHKEVTVLFVPDLSECLPSFDAWKTQWLEHRRAVADRERLNDLKREKEEPKEEPRVEKAANNSAKKEGKKSESDESDSKGDKKVDKNFIEEEKKEDGSNEKEDKLEGEQVKSDEKDEKGETSAVSAKTVKKKIVKKVVRKVADTGASAVENAVADPQVEKLDGKYGGEDDAKLEIGSPSSESPANTSNTKTIVRKKVANMVPVGKSTLKETKDASAEVKTEEEPAEDSPAETDDHVAKESPVKTEDPAAETGEEPVAKITGTKTTIKRKIIKKVPKKKPTGVEATEGEVKDEMVDAEDSGKQSTDTNIQASEANCSAKKKSPAAKTPVSSGKKSAVPDASKVELKGGKSENGSKFGKKSGMEGRPKEVIEKKQQEEPPRPGFILKTKSNKETKVRSLSLSLESLLDYTGKDIDDSTFEISVFAESVYEMLQYQMASRIFAFLQKLRIRFVSKRNQRKREREETDAKDKEKEKTSSKRSKNDDAKANDCAEKAIKVEKEDNGTESNPKADDGEEVPSANDGTENMEEEGPDDEAVQVDEDPEEEDPEEEDDEMKDANSPPPKSADEENDNEKTEVAVLPGEKVENKEKAEESAKGNSDKTNTDNISNPDLETSKDKKAIAEDNKKESPAPNEVAVDKELLQAFRFFDRNRVGYIRVEDMRLIIHAMGKYLSHRDVKELVQSALLESNTGRDDHILYNKLVRMADS
uniref:EF-hand domain-containing protein n=1 Tax=Kalanchoe fedtschenkoi TaxID=63787 RepID=A0A7N0UJN5_KALFE